MTDHLKKDRPSAWVARFARLVPEGEVLDLACGGGRHSRLFAGLGHRVLAVDRDVAALSATASQNIRTCQFDLERDGAERDPGWPLQPARYAGIVVTNYLHRPLFSSLLASLAPGGVLIYETFAVGNGQFGKPSNPAFLLGTGELLRAFGQTPGLRILAFEDGHVIDPAPAMVQRICCRRDALGDTSPSALRL